MEMPSFKAFSDEMSKIAVSNMYMVARALGGLQKTPTQKITPRMYAVVDRLRRRANQTGQPKYNFAADELEKHFNAFKTKGIRPPGPDPKHVRRIKAKVRLKKAKRKIEVREILKMKAEQKAQKAVQEASQKAAQKAAEEARKAKAAELELKHKKRNRQIAIAATGLGAGAIGAGSYALHRYNKKHLEHH